MPALPAVPSTLRLDFLYDIGSDNKALTRMFFTYTGSAPSNATCDSIAVAANGFWAATFKGYMCATSKIAGCTVEDLTSPSSGVGADFTVVTGTRAGTALPANVAALINFKIGRRYRGGKPRIYLPVGADGDQADSQHWLGSFVTNVQTGLTGGFLPAFLGSVYASTTISQHVAVGYYHGFTAVTNPITGRTRDVPTPKAGPITPDPVIAYLMNPIIGSQRRRTLMRA